MSDNDIIIITAARPGLWFKERLTPSAIKRWMGEKFYKDYGKTMDKLRQIDDAIYEWVKDIDNLNEQLKERKKSSGGMSDQKVIDIAILLGAINKKFKKINEAGNILEEINEKHLNKFEEQFSIKLPKNIYDLEEEEKEDLKRLRSNAGFWDSIKQNWISKKRESEDSKKRAQEINDISQKAMQMSKRLKSYLKTMSKARANGDINQYLDTLNLISKEQQEFETAFVTVYREHIKGPVERMMLELSTDVKKEEQVFESYPEEIEVELPESEDESIKTLEDHKEELESGISKDWEPLTYKDVPITEIPPTQEDFIYPSSFDHITQKYSPKTQKSKEPSYSGPKFVPEYGQLTSGPGKARKGPVIIDVEEAPETKSPPQTEKPSSKFPAGQWVSKEEYIAQQQEQKKKDEEWLKQFYQKQKALDEKFLEGLKESSDQYQMAAFIAKYSENFEDINPQKSAELLTIAENLLSNKPSNF